MHAPQNSKSTKLKLHGALRQQNNNTIFTMVKICIYRFLKCQFYFSYNIGKNSKYPKNAKYRNNNEYFPHSE